MSKDYYIPFGLGRPLLLDSLRIVLVNPSHPGNIGAVARAMKNMGLSNLVLVDPDHFPHPQATFRSSGATDILDSARVVSTIDEALADCQWVVGTSARSRTLPWPMLEPRQFAEDVAGRWQDGPVAILFGREERGLTNEELQRCHHHVQIPANPEYPVLNIAMAVQIICYELRCRSLLGTPEATERLPSDLGPQGEGWDEAPATVDDVERFLEHLEQTLVKVGFHDPANPRQLMPRLRRLYQRARMDKMEINILRGSLKAILKALPEQD